VGISLWLWTLSKSIYTEDDDFSGIYQNKSISFNPNSIITHQKKLLFGLD
jgi:hypothetical protein